VASPREVVLASRNPHKLAELRRALPGWEITPLPHDGYPPEDGATYEENASLKARFARDHAPVTAWVVGEDSGIEAAALGGRPGVESARWDDDGVARMLAELDGIGDRRARYVCAIVALGPGGEAVTVTGTLEGAIVDGGPRGSEGFGYDPIFVPQGEARTVAELGDAWKRLHSHRAVAAGLLAQALERR
jgi:XTP/dITP diphosphohydrolase